MAPVATRLHDIHSNTFPIYLSSENIRHQAHGNKTKTKWYCKPWTTIRASRLRVRLPYDSTSHQYEPSSNFEALVTVSVLPLKIVASVSMIWLSSATWTIQQSNVVNQSIDLSVYLSTYQPVDRSAEMCVGGGLWVFDYYLSISAVFGALRLCHWETWSAGVQNSGLN